MNKNIFIHNTAKLTTSVHIGYNSEIHANCSIGKYSFINNNSILYSNVKIGKYCSIARNVEIGVAMYPTSYEVITRATGQVITNY